MHLYLTHLEQTTTLGSLQKNIKDSVEYKIMFQIKISIIIEQAKHHKHKLITHNKPPKGAATNQLKFTQMLPPSPFNIYEISVAWKGKA